MAVAIEAEWSRRRRILTEGLRTAGLMKHEADSFSLSLTLVLGGETRYFAAGS